MRQCSKPGGPKLTPLSEQARATDWRPIDEATTSRRAVRNSVRPCARAILGVAADLRRAGRRPCLRRLRRERVRLPLDGGDREETRLPRSDRRRKPAVRLQAEPIKVVKPP